MRSCSDPKSSATCDHEISSDLVRFPVISRVYLGHSTVFADEDGHQPVNDLAVFLVVRQAKVVCDSTHLLRRSGSEFPIREPWIDAANVTFTVAAKHGGLVVLRIDADAE